MNRLLLPAKAAAFFVSDKKSRQKIIALLLQDNTLSAAALARRIGIPPKAVEKQIARMKADRMLRRIGPDKGGHWQVVEKPSK